MVAEGNVLRESKSSDNGSVKESDLKQHTIFCFISHGFMIGARFHSKDARAFFITSLTLS